MIFEKDRSAFVFIEFQQEWIGPDARLKHLLVKDEQSTYFEHHILHHFGQGIKTQELLDVI